jgi:hypothetical protein
MKAEAKARRTDPAKDVQGDSATFVEFARKLIAVPHAEIEAELKRKPSVRSSASRVSGAGSKRVH